MPRPRPSGDRGRAPAGSGDAARAGERTASAPDDHHHRAGQSTCVSSALFRRLLRAVRHCCEPGRRPGGTQMQALSSSSSLLPKSKQAEGCYKAKAPLRAVLARGGTIAPRAWPHRGPCGLKTLLTEPVGLSGGLRKLKPRWGLLGSLGFLNGGSCVPGQLQMSRWLTACCAPSVRAMHASSACVRLTRTQ